jgi:CheY-like chemotaxis protein
MAHILIAEDDLEMRRMLALLAELRGHRVQAVADGDALVAAALSSQPDALVTDVRMPNRTGLDALAEVRRTHADLPAVVITAFGDHQVHQRAAALGAHCINKPFDPDDLLDLVERIAGGA